MVYNTRLGFQVTAVLEDGRTFDGDILVGADGIRSKVSILHDKMLELYSKMHCRVVQLVIECTKTISLTLMI